MHMNYLPQTQQLQNKFTQATAGNHNEIFDLSPTFFRHLLRIDPFQIDGVKRPEFGETPSFLLTNDLH